MPDYREKATRGTPDFPFAYYKMRRGEGFSNMVNLHWHTEIEMIYILNGEATVNVSEERHILKAGDIFFINPEELHIIKPQTLPLSYEVAVFSPELLEFKEGHFFEKEFNDIEEAPNGCRGFIIVYDFRRVAEYEVYVPDDFYAIAMIINDSNNPMIKRWVSGNVDFPTYDAKWAAGEIVNAAAKK